MVDLPVGAGLLGPSNTPVERRGKPRLRAGILPGDAGPFDLPFDIGLFDRAERVSRVRGNRLIASDPTAILRLISHTSTNSWSVQQPALSVSNSIWRKSRILLDGEGKRALVAQLCLHLPATIDTDLPKSVLDLYPNALRSLVDFLESDGDYNEDLFAKDLRFVSGVSAPLGAQFGDLRFSNSAVARAGLVKRSVASSARLLLSEGPARAWAHIQKSWLSDWIQIHTDTRALTDFNAEGWSATYARIAEVLSRRSALAGLLGISWFYDPKVSLISPRLSYLSDLPLAHGAYLVRLKATELDRRRAGATSPTRKHLIATGAFSPRSYALFWPREALLNWANSRSSGTEELAAPKSARRKL